MHMIKRSFQIYRYDRDKDVRPTMQSLEVELDGSERMLLEARVPNPTKAIGKIEELTVRRAI